MSKAMLIGDMPEMCYRCSCCNREERICQVFQGKILNIHSERPAWCPLHEVPKRKVPKVEKIGVSNLSDFSIVYEKGYNDCINDILKFVGGEKNE